MAITIKDLQPREVWKHFEALTQVPRPSGHLEKIQKFLLDFGKYETEIGTCYDQYMMALAFSGSFNKMENNVYDENDAAAR